LRTREEKMAKRLNIFLVSKLIMVDPKRIRSWVEVRGDSDLLPILLQIEKEWGNNFIPFKFNSQRLKYEEFTILVTSE
jgi:hypothetical protein